jgi:hypothetical protein
MSKYRPVKPVPIPPDYSAPDITIAMAMYYLGLSARSIQRLCERGVLISFRYGEVEARRITFESVRALRERAIAAGPRLAEPPPTGTRGRGRPRKHPEAQAPAAAE